MLVVVASRHDEPAKALVTRWAAHDARLLTCEDLSVAGWRHYSDGRRPSRAVISGREVGVEEISGVLTRLPCVVEHELTHIIPVDRAYVAAEMTAFLTAWLTGLRCPVVNRPTPTCLSGPNWRPEQWVYAAAQVGIPVHPLHRRVSLGSQPGSAVSHSKPVTVTVLGDRWFGSVAPEVAIQARRLADAAKVELLAVRFSGPDPGCSFVSANIWPEFGSDDLLDALLAYLNEKRRTTY